MRNLLTVSEAVERRHSLRTRGQTLVFTNGHFDLLHVGHLDYLEQARSLGDALYVGVNGDPGTEALKGIGRPIVAAEDRARLVAGLWCVDAAIIFDGNTADSLIEALRPEIYVKGGDYATKVLPERPLVERYGGHVVLLDLLPGHSTSALINRIRALPKPESDN